jgi:hypothetical protein
VTTGLIAVVQSRQWVADGTTVEVLLVASRTEQTRPHLRVDVIVVGTKNIAKDAKVIVQIAGGDGVRRHGRGKVGMTSIVEMAIALVGGSKQ